MRYDIYSWEELEQFADECSEQDRLVFYIQGREIRTRIDHNIYVNGITLGVNGGQIKLPAVPEGADAWLLSNRYLVYQDGRIIDQVEGKPYDGGWMELNAGGKDIEEVIEPYQEQHPSP